MRSSELEVDFDYTYLGNYSDATAVTILNVKDFWSVDGKDHNYLFAITGDGTCLALREKMLRLGGASNRVHKFVSESKHEFPFLTMTKITIGEDVQHNDSSLLSVSNVRIFARAVTWEEAFPQTRGTKRDRAKAECVAGMQHL